MNHQSWPTRKYLLFPEPPICIWISAEPEITESQEKLLFEGKISRLIAYNCSGLREGSYRLWTSLKNLEFYFDPWKSLEFGENFDLARFFKFVVSTEQQWLKIHIYMWKYNFIFFFEKNYSLICFLFLK